MGNIKTGKELAEKCLWVAKNFRTLYVNGAFGWPLSASNKTRTINEYAYNRKTERAAKIQAASSNTFGFDCVNLIKAILWGWTGDTAKQYGGAVYASNGVPDIGENTMIARCSGVSTNFSNIAVGEVVWMSGHIGVYVGNGLAVECSPKWADGVQVTAVGNIGAKAGYNTRTWTKHGKLPYVSYSEEVSGVYSKIPLDNIEKIAIVFGNGRTISKIKADIGCDYIINGGLYNMSTNKPVEHLKVDGVVYAKANYSNWGYLWDVGPDIRMEHVPENTRKNLITCVNLLNPWDGKKATLSYDPALGGARGRTAMALTKDSLILWCSKDGSKDAMTPDGLRDKLVAMGVENAIMLDGGGSSQCILPEGTITSTRNVNNYIAVWLKGSAKSTGTKYTVNTGSDKLNVRSGPGTNYSAVSAYANGTVVTVYNTSGSWGQTDAGWVFMSYLIPVAEPVVTRPETPVETPVTTPDYKKWAQELDEKVLAAFYALYAAVKEGK